jgi:iron complex outermembrane receptor protein
VTRALGLKANFKRRNTELGQLGRIKMKIFGRFCRANLNYTGTSSAVIAAGLILTSPAMAEDTLNTEIVVTARKVSENLQDVPVSISALTSDAITNAGIDTASDISKLAPNFQSIPQGAFGTSFPSLVIRGQTAGGLTLNADQAVGVYVNGAPIPRSPGLFNNLFDVERIEVLKGPQGTLYGKNTTGGAVNVITKAPKFNEFSGYVSATVGNYNRHDIEGVVNIPLVDDQLAVRIGAILTNRDGFGRGAVTGRELSDDNEFAVRGSVLFEPSETVTIQINGNYHETDEKGSINRSLVTVLGGLVSQESLDPDIYVGNEFGTVPQTDRFDEWSLNMKATVDLGEVTAESITSYREFGIFYEYRRIPLTGNLITQDADMFSQELRFSGSAMSDRLQWQAGAFYSTESGEDADFLPQLGQFELTSAKNSGWAVFTQSSFAINDKFNLTLGIRYTDEHREVSDLEVGAPILFAEADFSAWSWLASLDYSVTDDVLLYASASKGFKSGGLDVGDLSNVIEPEFVKNYEVGFKGDLFDDAWRLNASLFYSDYSNIQRLTFDPTAAIPTTVIRNIAEATIWGFEVESTMRPVEGLTLSQTVGLTKPKYDEYLDLDPFGNVVDLSDDPFPGPRWQVSVSGRYEFDASDNARVGIQANYFWISEDDQGTPALLASLTPEQARLEAYGTLNAQIDIDIESGVNLAVFGTNLTDKEYFSAAFITPLGPLGTVSDRITGNPRTWGVRLTKRF